MVSRRTSSPRRARPRPASPVASRVEDREATQAVPHGLFSGHGPEHLDVIDTPSGSWVRGCVWWDDTEPSTAEGGYLAFEATSSARFQWIDYRLQRLWPPAFRSGHSTGPLTDTALDGPPFMCARPAGWEPSPVRRALRERIIDAERAWIRAPAALLSGAVPLETARDEMGRARVAGVLAQATRRPGAEVGGASSFNVDRVLALLGRAALPPRSTTSA